MLQADIPLNLLHSPPTSWSRNNHSTATNQCCSLQAPSGTAPDALPSSSALTALESNTSQKQTPSTSSRTPSKLTSISPLTGPAPSTVVSLSIGTMMKAMSTSLCRLRRPCTPKVQPSKPALSSTRAPQMGSTCLPFTPTTNRHSRLGR